jgi:hypothetical protein
MRPKRDIDITEIEKYYRIEEDGAIFSLRKQKYLKATFNTAGYLFVCITTPEESRFYSVHRIVATKYLGTCPPELETSHKDGNKLNNHYTNLEYLSHSENILKSYKEHGREPSMHTYRQLPVSYETKRKMSDAKKKSITYTLNGHDSIYDSIETAAKELNTYRKKIYTCITNDKPFLGGFFSFTDGIPPVL